MRHGLVLAMARHRRPRDRHGPLRGRVCAERRADQLDAFALRGPLDGPAAPRRVEHGVTLRRPANACLLLACRAEVLEQVLIGAGNLTVVPRAAGSAVAI